MSEQISQREQQHNDLISQIESSWKVDRKETIKLVKSAYEAINREIDPQRKEEAVKAYETLRQKIVQEYTWALKEDKGTLSSLKSDIKQPEVIKGVKKDIVENFKDIKQFEIRINTAKSIDDLDSESKKRFYDNIDTIIANISNKEFIISAINYSWVEAVNQHWTLSIYEKISPKLKNEREVVEAAFRNYSQKQTFHEKEQITRLVPKDYIRQKENLISLVKLLWENGYDTGHLVPTMVNEYSKNTKEKALIYSEIFNILNNEQKEHILHDVEDDVFWEIKNNVTHYDISEEVLANAEKNRQVNTETLKSLFLKIQNWAAESMTQEEITFINTQLIRAGWIRNNREVIKKLVDKNPNTFIDLTVVQSDLEIAKTAIEKKKWLFLYASEGVKNNVDVLKIVFDSQESYDVFKNYLSSVTDPWARRELLNYLKQKNIDIWDDINVGYQLRSSENTFSKQIDVTLEGFQTQEIENSVKAENIKFTKNENGSYTVFIQGQRIPWLSETELWQLKNEKGRENLIHFFNVLKDCWLLALWRQRGNIFKAISNQKGMAFDTKNGDYLSKNEVAIFLKSIIKSVAGQFENQSQISQILSTEKEGEIVLFIKNFNGKNNITWPARDKFWRTKIVEAFFDTYLPKNKDKQFQLASFQNSQLNSNIG